MTQRGQASCAIHATQHRPLPRAQASVRAAASTTWAPSVDTAVPLGALQERLQHIDEEVGKAAGAHRGVVAEMQPHLDDLATTRS